MKKVCLIGNYGQKTNGKDGQTVKVRIYLEALKKENIAVNFIDTSFFSKHPISILFRIKRAIKNHERIILITAKNGSKLLLPYINFCNKKIKTPIIFPLIGTSVLHFTIDRLTKEETYEFLTKRKCDNLSNTRFTKLLSNITYVLPETDLLTSVFSKYYGLSNCKTLTNFRFEQNDKKHFSSHSRSKYLHIVYLSRVVDFKGIFDLVECVKTINLNGAKIKLDIFGDNYLNKKDNDYFKSLLDDYVVYKGSAENNGIIDLISNYDVFAFPTKAPGEGAPGVIMESLIAGVPVLTSCFPNANCLLKNGYDSIFYEMFNKEDLGKKLLWCVENRTTLYSMKSNALISSKKYTYGFSREKFLKYVCGE